MKNNNYKYQLVASITHPSNPAYASPITGFLGQFTQAAGEFTLFLRDFPVF
ncbi:MAG: hypothetical protein AAF465_09165 [Pseudomonadota bacterium]